MPKKRKEPTLYAVKRPDGTLWQYPFESKIGAWEDFIFSTNDEEIRKYDSISLGQLRKLGYRVVKVKLAEVE